MIDRTEVRLDLTPGKLYDYAPWTKDSITKESVRRVFGVYKVIGVSREIRTGQENVICETAPAGIDYPGVWSHCGYANFANCFLPHKPTGSLQVRQADPPPEKVMDATIKGSGV